MSTIVCFHAHPDDECIGTGGLLALANKLGHRTVLVTATDGRHGEIAEGSLTPGQSLVEARAAELAQSCEILGVSRLVMLGYADSGMIGTPENDAPESFWMASVEDAAQNLAEILRQESADILTVYDDHGGYGHPDHIQVHRVGYRAAELAGIDSVYEATMNRDRIRRQWLEAKRNGVDLPFDPEADDFDMGTPESELTHVLDVGDFVALKRQAMRAHASQIAADSMFLTMPDEMFLEAFGMEFYRHRATETADPLIPLSL